MTTATERLNRLRQIMAKKNIDLVAIGPGAHMKWLLGFHPHADERPCLLFISHDGSAFLMPTLNAKGTRENTDLTFHEWDDAAGPDDALQNLLRGLNVGAKVNLALDETMRADFAAIIQKALPYANRQFSASTVGALRMRKYDDEYECLKRNAKIADNVMQAAWQALKAGKREKDIAAVVRKSFEDQGAQAKFHIIGASKNGAFPHHQTGETVLKERDAIVIDIGGTVEGYFSDITRMAVLGQPPEGYNKIHQIVDQAVEAAMQAARPGVRACDIDAAARGVIITAGYGEYFIHRTGHGLGIEIHEQPYITSTSETVLEEGMVFSIEPGIYLPDRFGVRLEEIVIMRPDGPEIFSDLPRTVKIL
ncbi:MAG: peptidase M24 [Aestuariivita sp.]|nr:peptidase M24 [Aestuariivita sp.]